MGNTPYSVATPEDNSALQEQTASVRYSEPLSSKEVADSKKEAINFIIGANPECQGVNLSNRDTLLELFRDALREYKISHSGHEDTPRIYETILTKEQAVVARFVGLAGEFLSKPLDTGRCSEIFKTFDSLGTKDLKWQDPHEFLIERTGGSRKDSLLLWYYFETELLPNAKSENELVEAGELNKTQLEQVRNAVIHVLNNYQEVLDSWKKTTKSQRPVGRNELLFWYLEENKMKLPGQKGKKQNSTIINAIDFISHTDEHEMAVSTLSGTPSIYNAVKLPDRIGLNSEQKAVSAVEVKAYTPEEFDTWVAVLGRVASLEVTPKNESEEERTERLAELALYDRQGLQVNILDGSCKGMRLGVDTDGLRLTLNIINGEQPGYVEKKKIDYVDPETAEVTSNVVELYPQIVLRLPSGLSKDSISKLGEAVGNFGIRNLVVEELPFDSKEIRDLAYSMFMYRTLKVNKNNVYDPSKIPAEYKAGDAINVMNALKDRNYWKI